VECIGMFSVSWFITLCWKKFATSVAGRPGPQPFVAEGHIVRSLPATRRATNSSRSAAWRSVQGIPSGNLTVCYWKWPIYSGFTHWKWWFSIVMLVYQREHTCFGCFGEQKTWNWNCLSHFFFLKPIWGFIYPWWTLAA
jgi:hypothetical protein